MSLGIRTISVLCFTRITRKIWGLTPILSCSYNGMSPSVINGKAIKPVACSLSFMFIFKQIWRWTGVLGRKSKARRRHCKRFQWIPISRARELGTGLKFTLINENVSSKDTPSTLIYNSHWMQSCPWYTAPLLLSFHICKLIFQRCTLGYIPHWQARSSPLCVHIGSVSRRKIKRGNEIPSYEGASMEGAFKMYIA